MEYRVEVQTVSQGAYDRLYELIVTGHFKPGQSLKERELAELLGISRTPIREALRKLETEKLLVSTPHRGYRMPIPTAKEMQNFYELRAELEGMAARLAAERASQMDLAKLTSLLEEAKAYLRKRDISQMVTLNNNFHHQLAMCTGNTELVSSLQRLRADIDLYRVLLWSSHQERPAHTLQQHEKILGYVIERNTEMAQRSANTHIWDSFMLVSASLKLLE